MIAALPKGFDRAVQNARHGLKIQAQVVKREYWSRMVILERPTGYTTYCAAFKESAWTEPAETPILPWSPPTGRRVAIVDLDGAVTLL